MLGTIRIQRPLTRQITRVVIPFLAEETVLLALELVQEDFVKGFVEVLLDTGDDFLEDVKLDSALSVRFFLGGVLVHDLVDGVLGREGDNLAVFGDVFPVID